MPTEAQSTPKTPSGQPKRRLRNFLLDARFQLKYTGMVVAVTVLVTSAVGFWLGREAYVYSIGMSDMLLMQHPGAAVSPDMHALFEAETREADAKTLRNIVIGVSSLVAILAIALGLTGIVITHRVVGPAYKLKLLLGDVERGSLNVKGDLRKGDELQDVGNAFKRMLRALRQRREEELAQLTAAIDKARNGGANEAALQSLEELRERLQRTLEG